MRFLTKIEKDLEWIELSVTPEGYLVSLKSSSDIEFAEEDWPLLIFDFKTDCYYCLSKISMGKTGQFIVVRYKLNTDYEIFGCGETVLSNKATSYEWKMQLKENLAPQYLFKRSKLKGEPLILLYHAFKEQLLSQKEQLKITFEQDVTAQTDQKMLSTESKEEPISTSNNDILSFSKSIQEAVSFQQDTELLPLLAYLSEVAEPLEFCGIVVTLLKKNIPFLNLVESGILGDFFKQNANNFLHIEQAYHFLHNLTESSSEQIPFLSELLANAKKYRIDINREGMECIALDTSIASNALPVAPHSITVLLRITPLLENIETLHAFLKEGFFLLLITKADNWNELKPLVLSYLERFSLEEKIALTKAMLSNSLSTISKDKLFSILSLDVLTTLLDDTDSLVVLEVLHAFPDVREHFSPEKFHPLLSSMNVTKDNFNTALFLSTQAFLVMHQITLQEKLADFLLTLSSEYRYNLFTHAVSENFKKAELISWGQKQAGIYYQQLKDTLASESLEDVFDTLERLFLNTLPKIKFLKSFLPSLSFDYPCSQHEFRGWVLTQLDKEKSLILNDALAILFKRFDEDYENATNQTIARLHALAYCPEALQACYIESIISLVKIDFSLFFPIFLSHRENKKFFDIFLAIINQMKADYVNIVMTSLVSPGNKLRDHVIVLLRNSTEALAIFFNASSSEHVVTFFTTHQELKDDIWISNITRFFELILFLDPEKITQLFEGMKEKVKFFHITTEKFSFLLRKLSPEQCRAVCEAMPTEHIRSITRDSEDFVVNSLKHLSPVQCKAVCEVREIFRLICFFHLRHLTPEQCTAIYSTITVEEVQTITRNPSNFIYNLKDLTLEKCTSVCMAMQTYIKTHINNILYFESIVAVTLDQFTLICTAMQEHIQSIIKSGHPSDFYVLLYQLRYEPKKGTLVYKIVAEQLPVAITTLDDLMKILEHLPPDERLDLCQRMKNQQLMIFDHYAIESLTSSWSKTVFYCYLECQKYINWLSSEFDKELNSNNKDLIEKKILILNEAQDYLMRATDEKCQKLWSILTRPISESDTRTALLVPRTSRTATFFNRTTSPKGKALFHILFGRVPNVNEGSDQRSVNNNSLIN